MIYANTKSTQNGKPKQPHKTKSKPKIENIGSRVDTQTHAGNGIAARVSSNRRPWRFS